MTIQANDLLSSLLGLDLGQKQSEENEENVEVVLEKDIVSEDMELVRMRSTLSVLPV